jgi:DNA-binding SARP family transcriptional activator/tetratricopeptide (TPR) repeat protein
VTDGVDIRLLGRFTVQVGARRIDEADWTQRRPMELVQLLALAPGRARPREQVIDALWPSLAPDPGASNLRKAAHHARRLLGEPDAIVLRGGLVHLFPGASVSTDLERFRAAASAALRTGDPRECLGAADLARGDLLPGSLYEEWTTDERRQLRSTLLTLLRTAAAWDRLVELDPTDELAHQELMRAALRSGRRSEVVNRFEDVRSALVSGLGVRPSATTVAIYEEAIEGLVDAGRELVGRDRELAVVETALRAERPRRAGLVAVHGPAGIGKSAFCRHLVASLEHDGYAVRWTDTAGHDQPFGPLVNAIEEVLLDPRELWTQVPPHIRAVLASVSDLVPEAPPLTGPLTRHQVLGAVTQIFRVAAGGRRTVVVLDDAHEADQGSIELMLHIATSVPDMLAVLAFRPESVRDDLEEGLARLARAGCLVDVGLGALGPTAAAELVRRAAAGCLDESEVGRIVERAGGNPFALTELASTGCAGEELERSIAASITSRLVNLDSDTVAALGRLALARDELDRDLVLALTGWDEPAAFALLDRLLDAGVLVVAGRRYRFRHDLVRDALRVQVAPHRSLVVHREAAQRLAERGAPPAAVAHHYLEADEPSSAVPWCISAATDAMAVGAYRDARRHLAPVLRHDPAHAGALRLEAEALDMLGDPRTLAAYDAAIAVADEETADDLVVARALAQIKQGDPAGGLAAAEGATPRSMMGRLNAALAYAGAAALGATDPAIGTEKANEVRRLALESGDRAAIVIAAWAHAAAAHARGDLHDSVLSDLRDTADIPHLAVRVFDGHLCMTQRFLYGSRPYDEVIAFAEQLTAEAERLDALRGRAFGITLRAEALYLSGHLDEALDGFREGLVLHRQTGGTTGEAHALQRLAELWHSAERHADAHATIGEALDLARMSDIGFHLLDRIYGSRIHVATDPDDALSAVEEAESAVRGPLETCPGCRIHLAVPAAIASARAGDLERAHAYADAVDYLADVVMRLPAWYAARDEVRAHVALATGDRAGARRCFEAAARGYARAGHPLDERRCRVAC